jgi:hypothetical protein
MLLAATLPVMAPAPAPAGAADGPVALQEEENSYTLDNGIVTAQVNKRNGNLTSLIYTTCWSAWLGRIRPAWTG